MKFCTPFCNTLLENIYFFLHLRNTLLAYSTELECCDLIWLEFSLASHEQTHSYGNLKWHSHFVHLRRVRSIIYTNPQSFFLKFSQLFITSIATEEIYHQNKIMKHSFDHFQELRLKYAFDQNIQAKITWIKLLTKRHRKSTDSEIDIMIVWTFCLQTLNIETKEHQTEDKKNTTKHGSNTRHKHTYSDLNDIPFEYLYTEMTRAHIHFFMKSFLWLQQQSH